VLRTFSVYEICRILAGEQHANSSVKIKLQKIRQTGFSQFVAVWSRDRKPTHPPHDWVGLNKVVMSSLHYVELTVLVEFWRYIWGKGRMFYIVRKDKCVCALKSFWICDKSVDRNLCFGSDTVTKSLAFTYVNFCLFICKQWTETLIVSGQAL
jgi:hypothetical protein